MTELTEDDRQLDYGSHADQHVSLSFTAAPAAKGTAVLVHGGYWRERIDASVMHPMRQSLLDAGWNVANVEYRRGPSHPWPIPTQDVRAALHALRHAMQDPVLPGPLILIGHSVGGQLVLLNSDLSDATVGLAPVTDVARVFDEDLGESAAAEYFGKTPAEAPAIYRDASPLRHPVPEARVLLVHGQDDDRVPLRHTEDYVKISAGNPRIDTMFHAKLDHFGVISPAEHHWEAVLRWMESVSAGVHAQ